jgi:porin
MIQFLRCSSAFSVLLIGSLSSILAVPASAIESQERSPSELDLSPQTEIVRPTSEVSSQKPKTTDRAIAPTPPPPLTENNLPKLTFNQGNAKDLTPLTPRTNNLGSGTIDLEPSLFVQAPATPGAKPEPSEGLNLLVFRSLKKPISNKVLDSGVSVSGIKPKDTSGNFFRQDFLSGEWRKGLYDQGIDIYAAHASEYFTNLGGGQEKGGAYNATTIFGLDLYSDKLRWYSGGQFHVTAAWLEGVSVASQFTGSLNTLYFADAPRKGFRLFELWYGQKFDNNKGEVRIGKIYPFVRIGASQNAGFFQNQSFGYPTFIGSAPTSGASTVYASAPLGLQVSYALSPQFTLIGQIQDGFDDPSGGTENFQGFSVGLSSKEGIEGITELVYRLNQEPGAKELPGTYRLGFQFHTGEFKNQYLNSQGLSLVLNGGSPKFESGNYGLYFIAEQMIFRESSDPSDRRQGLQGFFKTAIYPKDTINTVTWNIAGGFTYEGLISGRDRDVVGVGFTYTQLSSSLRNYDQDRNTTVRDGETVLELVYGAEIAPWWVVLMSLQRVLHPGGSAVKPDATVLGISSRFAL